MQNSIRNWKYSAIAAFGCCLLLVWMFREAPPEEIFARGLSAIGEKKFDLGAECAESLSGTRAFRQHASVLRGMISLENGDPHSALREFSAARPVGALRKPLLLSTAQALYRTGAIFEAGTLLAVLIDEDPGNAEAHRWLGAVHYDLGNQGQAIVELTEATRLNPDDYRPHRLLGLICTDESKFGLAVEHYRTALRLGKDVAQPDIVEDLATILIQRNRFVEALEVLKDAAPTAANWALRADCYDGLGESESARNAVQSSLRLDPDCVKALRLWGTQQLSDGNAADAIAPLQRVLKSDPHDTKARYQLSMAFSRLGQNEAAIREMKAHDASVKLHEEFYGAAKQAAAEPGNIPIRERLAAIATTLGKPEVAKRWELAAVACRNALEDDGSLDRLRK